MQTYSARQQYTSEDSHEILVSSSRCLYKVWMSDEDIQLLGPGVNETSEADSFPQFDSLEDLAIHIVMLFESGLWPKD